MKKRDNVRLHVLLPILLLLLTWTALSVPELSASAAGNTALLNDGADLLSDKEESKVLKKLTKVSDKRDCDIAVITTGDLYGQEAVDYVDEQIDATGLGSGRQYGTATLLIFVDQNDPSNREVRIATDQTANAYFSDEDNNRVLDEIFDDLRAGAYADAISGYADACDAVFGEALGESGSRGVSPGWIFGDLGIGAVIAFMLGQFHKGRLKTARRRSGASDYEADGGIHFAVNRDTFLDKRVERRRIERDDGPRESGHEAGTTHTTSSGSKHGGAGRKF